MKIRKIKDSELKKAVKIVARIMRAHKRSKRQPEESCRVSVNIKVSIEIRNSKQKPKKSDKQRSFLNRGQKNYLARVQRELNKINDSQLMKFIRHNVTQEEMESATLAMADEASFMKYHKRLPKRKEIKYTAILLWHKKKLTLLKKFSELKKHKELLGRALILLPLNNKTLHEFKMQQEDR